MVRDGVAVSALTAPGVAAGAAESGVRGGAPVGPVQTPVTRMRAADLVDDPGAVGHDRSSRERGERRGMMLAVPFTHHPGLENPRPSCLAVAREGGCGREGWGFCAIAQT